VAELGEARLTQSTGQVAIAQHARDVEVLDDHGSMFGNQPTGQFMEAVASDGCCPRFDYSDPSASLLLAVTRMRPQGANSLAFLSVPPAL